MRKLIVKSSLLIVSCLILLTITSYLLPISSAQSSLCEPGTNPRAEGLVSAPDLGGSKFGTTSRACIVEERAAFISFKIPSFDDLEAIYYTQAKSSSTINRHLPQDSGNIDLGDNTDHIYYFTGDLSITSPSTISGNRTGVIFVKKDLNIGPIPSDKVKVGGRESGIVYVVGGNVNIDPTVDEIDGVIIAQGTIYTAGADCRTSQVTEISAGLPIKPLKINGSLISLNSGAPIKFCRKLDDNSAPSEEINHQAKYLVILKDIFADNLQKWSEVTSVSSVPSITPPGTPPPPPTPIGHVGCSDQSAEQVYSSRNMIACDGSVSFFQAGSLCGRNWHKCSTQEYLSRGGTITIPGGSRFFGEGNISGTTFCQSTLCGSTQCPLNQPGGGSRLVTSVQKQGYGSSCASLNPNTVGYFSVDSIGSPKGTMCCSQ